MNLLFRFLTAALLALWAAIPAIGGAGDGGENAGGTGVWILPRCESIGSNITTIGGGVPRVAPLTFGNLGSDIRLRLSNECGEATATLFEGESGAPIALPVVDQLMTLPAFVLQGLVAAGVDVADIVVIDAHNRGYLMRLHLDLAARTAALLVY
ncbi:MAG: hypothetical protein FJ265_05380 [Planctomycetes bacterium]|nr:hypothetical protein [Planctomycetota bacterium]